MGARRVRDKPVVVVIDDDALVRDAAASLIRALGYRTLLYPSADAYLAAASVEPACVVTDLQMPGRSGLELHACLRGRGATVPVILMTGFPTDALRAEAAMLGLIAVVEKPVDPERLAAALARAIG